MREVRNRFGWTQLFFFCSKGMTSSVKIMLDMKSIDVEARDGEDFGGMTCLIIAAAFGFLDICRLLIDKGADIEANDGITWNPLHWAVREGHIEIVRLLCDNGADVEACDRINGRPLHYAVIQNHISIVKELIDVRNADLNARDHSRWTAMRYARRMNRHDIAAYLVSHGGIE